MFLCFVYEILADQRLVLPKGIVFIQTFLLFVCIFLLSWIYWLDAYFRVPLTFSSLCHTKDHMQEKWWVRQWGWCLVRWLYALSIIDVEPNFNGAIVLVIVITLPITDCIFVHGPELSECQGKWISIILCINVHNVH